MDCIGTWTLWETSLLHGADFTSVHMELLQVFVVFVALAVSFGPQGPSTMVKQRCAPRSDYSL